MFSEQEESRNNGILDRYDMTLKEVTFLLEDWYQEK